MTLSIFAADAVVPLNKSIVAALLTSSSLNKVPRQLLMMAEARAKPLLYKADLGNLPGRFSRRIFSHPSQPALWLHREGTTGYFE